MTVATIVRWTTNFAFWAIVVFGCGINSLGQWQLWALLVTWILWGTSSWVCGRLS